MRGDLLGARQHVQAAQDDLRPPLPIPRPPAHTPASANVRCTVIPTTCGNGSPRRRTLQQVLVPVRHLPVRRRGPGDARQRQRRRQHVLAEAGVRVLGIERVDQTAPTSVAADPAEWFGSSRGATRIARGIHGVLMGASIERKKGPFIPVENEGGDGNFAPQSSIALQCKVDLSRTLFRQPPALRRQLPRRAPKHDVRPARDHVYCKPGANPAHEFRAVRAGPTKGQSMIDPAFATGPRFPNGLAISSTTPRDSCASCVSTASPLRTAALVVAICGLFVASAQAADGPIEFFEQAVRPILVEACIRCHGPDRQRGGLRLDSRQALIAGGESGPAIVPGDPDSSRLIAAVRRVGRAEDAAEGAPERAAGRRPDAVGRAQRPVARGRWRRNRPSRIAGCKPGPATGRFSHSPIRGRRMSATRRGSARPWIGSCWPGWKPKGCRRRRRRTGGP